MLIHKTEDVNALVGDARLLPGPSPSPNPGLLSSWRKLGLLLRNLFLNLQSEVSRVRKETNDTEVQLSKHRNHICDRVEVLL